MRLVTVAVVVGPRLLFGAELYGMNRKLTDKMQVLMNRALEHALAPGGAEMYPQLDSGRRRTLPICALAGARRARAYAKAAYTVPQGKVWIDGISSKGYGLRNYPYLGSERPNNSASMSQTGYQSTK